MKTKPVILTWEVRSTFSVLIDRGDQKCTIALARAKRSWLAVAVTTGSQTKTAKDFFDNHGHKIIGSYRTLGKAMIAAESWAAHWLKGHKVTNGKKCLCKEVA